MQPALDAVARHHHQDLPASVAAPSLPPVRRPGRGRDRAGAGRVHLGGADSRLLRRRGVQSAFDEAQAGIRQRPGGPWQLCRVLRLGHHLDPIPAPLGRIVGHRQRTGVRTQPYQLDQLHLVADLPDVLAVGDHDLVHISTVAVAAGKPLGPGRTADFLNHRRRAPAADPRAARPAPAATGTACLAVASGCGTCPLRGDPAELWQRARCGAAGQRRCGCRRVWVRLRVGN
jgi:hypothetical protein